jgi:hypothetical protein
MKGTQQYTGQDVRELMASHKRAMDAEAKRRTDRNICAECGKYPADLPSRRCMGCDAYAEHTR